MTPILFDLDRTLVDVQSFTDYSAALRDVEAMIGHWADPPTPPTGWDGPTRRSMGILVALNGDPRWQAVSDVIETHEQAAASRSKAMPGLAAALTAAAPSKRAVVTLLPENVTRRVLELHEVEISIIVPRRRDLRPKPAPDQVLEACRLLEVEPSEAVMIGDSTWDAESALSAGCGFVGVTNGRPSEFTRSTPTAEDLSIAVATAMAL